MVGRVYSTSFWDGNFGEAGELLKLRECIFFKATKYDVTQRDGDGFKMNDDPIKRPDENHSLRRKEIHGNLRQSKVPGPPQNACP